MGECSDIQREQIGGMPVAGASVTKTPTLLGESRAVVSKVMMTYTSRGRTSTVKRNSG
jgi:hypothetical protein